ATFRQAEHDQQAPPLGERQETSWENLAARRRGSDDDPRAVCPAGRDWPTTLIGLDQNLYAKSLRAPRGGQMRARTWRPRSPRFRSILRTRTLVIGFGALLAVAGTLFAAAPNASAALGFEVESLDGSGNNVAHPNWGQAITPYSRVAPTNYADGRSA